MANYKRYLRNVRLDYENEKEYCEKVLRDPSITKETREGIQKRLEVAVKSLELMEKDGVAEYDDQS